MGGISIQVNKIIWPIFQPDILDPTWVLENVLFKKIDQHIAGVAL